MKVCQSTHANCLWAATRILHATYPTTHSLVVTIVMISAVCYYSLEEYFTWSNWSCIGFVTPMPLIVSAHRQDQLQSSKSEQWIHWLEMPARWFGIADSTSNQKFLMTQPVVNATFWRHVTMMACPWCNSDHKSLHCTWCGLSKRSSTWVWRMNAKPYRNIQGLNVGTEFLAIFLCLLRTFPRGANQ